MGPHMRSGSGFRLAACVVAIALLGACGDALGAGDPTPSSSPTPIPGALPLARGGGLLHAGVYCPVMQVASPGNNALPVANGCLFHLSTPNDLFATDGGDYSASEVVAGAQMGVRGPDDAKVMIVCRLSPRAQFWFWVSADGNWNIDRVDDVHHPQDLVDIQHSQPLRQYVKSGGNLNDVQFKCASDTTGRAITLALNMNDHQFTALTVPMPAPRTPLTRPATPWFVDVGARLTSAGTLDGTVARVTLYDQE